jgi:hypothetical protein
MTIGEPQAGAALSRIKIHHGKDQIHQMEGPSAAIVKKTRRA